jgi:ferredoxin-NADP reductase
MRNRIEWRDAEVAEIRQVAKDVRQISFAVDGAVPRFDPGSHSNFSVIINGEATNRTYTVIPAAPGHIAIAVKLHPQSRGGSRFMWALNTGDAVRLTLPENRFELSWRAPHYLLLAGGASALPRSTAWQRPSRDAARRCAWSMGRDRENSWRLPMSCRRCWASG